MKSFMGYYGVGDHGGGATKESIKSIEELKSEKGAPIVFFSTTDNYFKEIRKDKLESSPSKRRSSASCNWLLYS